MLVEVKGFVDAVDATSVVLAVDSEFRSVLEFEEAIEAILDEPVLTDSVVVNPGVAVPLPLEDAADTVDNTLDVAVGYNGV